MMKSSVLCAVLLAICGQAFAGVVNINRADAKSLAKELQGVGPATASKIVAERAKGEYKDLKDLTKRVDGFGAKMAQRNADSIRFQD